MNKDNILDEIFNDDPYGLLNVEPSRQSNLPTSNELARNEFEKINQFLEKKSREPEYNLNSGYELQLYGNLKAFREKPQKYYELLKEYDVYNLLTEVEENQTNESTEQYKKTSQKYESIDDIIRDDIFGILKEDDLGLFDFKNISRQEDNRASADFIAKRKRCKNFYNYEELFKRVQRDLASGKRKLIPFKQEHLREGDFYVYNGVLLFLERVDWEKEEKYFKSGNRIREDGRTRTIFENGTESNLLYLSLYRVLQKNGRSVTQNFSITEEDKEAGYIYVLKSKSRDERIASIKDLFKIGYCKTEVEDRIKNAEREPTYLMASVEHITSWKCYNLNPQKFEQLIHNFFSNSCLDLDVYDEKGNCHSPREWFIAPLEVIEQAIELIINDEIVKYRYDRESKTIVNKSY